MARNHINRNPVNRIVIRLIVWRKSDKQRFLSIPVNNYIVILPREALGQGRVGKRLAVGGLDGRGGLVVGRRLCDGELELAGARVEAGAGHDGRRLAGAHVVAVPDRVGALGHDSRGDRRLVRRAVVGQAGGVDGEHRGVDVAGHAHLHGDVADGLVVGRVVGGEHRQEFMLARLANWGRSAVLPREALGQGHVGKRLAVGGLDGRGGLVVGRRLCDGELELAGARVEAGAGHDGRRLAGAHVVAVPDRVGALGHDSRGDRRLVRRAVVDEAVGVDGEHRGVDGAEDAHLHGDVADGLIVGRVARRERRQELMLAGVPHRSRGVVLPREALRQGHVGKPLAVGRLDGRGRAVVGRRLCDGELELAGAAVEALARHDGRRLAGAHVVAVPDRVGALGHDSRGDRRLVRRAVVDEAVGVDGEHRGVDGAEDAHLHGDVADGLIFRLIGRSVHSQVLMFPGVANIGVAGVLPREALGKHEVSKFLAVGSIQGRGSIKRRRLFRNIEFIVQQSDRAANAAYANRCSSGGDIIRIRNFVIDSLLKFRRPNFLRNLASGIWGIAAVHFKHVIAQGDLGPINVFRPRRNSGHRERIPGLVHPLPGPTFNQRRIDRYPAQVKPIPYRNLLKSQTDIEHGRHIADARGVPARKVERDERGTTGEHGRHIGYARCVPIRGIEGSQTGAAGEHPGHIRHAGGVPAGDVEGGELGAAVEHGRHARDGRGVPAGDVEGGER